MADLSQARTRGVIGAAGTRLWAANQFAGKSLAPASTGRGVKFPRERGPRRYGPRGR